MFSDLDDLVNETREKVIKGPFNWPGGKGRSLKSILPKLPILKRYVEPFGGSGVVLLNRRKSYCEVFNDRNSGVVDFYITVQSNLNELIQRLSTSCYSRENFLISRDTWVQTADRVERAARWYTMVCYSFGGLGRNFGRSDGMAGKIQRALPSFGEIHQRLQSVLLENADALQLCRDYDSPETVIYLDPPYVDTIGAYKFGYSHAQHRELIDWIKQSKAFVAVSGYPNPLYDEQTFWDEIISWESFVSITSGKNDETNNKQGIDPERGNATERLWIKWP